MNTVLFVNATTAFSDNLFLVFIVRIPAHFRDFTDDKIW